MTTHEAITALHRMVPDPDPTRPVPSKEQRLLDLKTSMLAACYWLDQNAPGRAREVLTEALGWDAGYDQEAAQ